MIALIRKNLRLWGYGKSLALFTGCILFSISGRLNGGIAGILIAITITIAKAALITLLITISFLFIFRNTTDLLLLVKLEHPNLPGIGQKIAAPPQLHFHFCHEHSPLIRLQPKIA